MGQAIAYYILRQNVSPSYLIPLGGNFLPVLMFDICPKRICILCVWQIAVVDTVR